MTKTPSSTYTLAQAMRNAGPLQHLRVAIAQSKALEQAVQQLIPPQLRTAFQSGMVQEGQWTLIVPHTSAAAKLRQLLPDLLIAAQACDSQVVSIHIAISPSNFRI